MALNGVCYAKKREKRERESERVCESERGQRAVLSPYLREQATIYDCRLSIINSYKLLLLLAVCLPTRGGQGVDRHNTLHLCVRAAADNIKQSA